MNDDSIAPVVAVMMILVVVVTLLSIWNAIYLPGFKQQAEVEHLKDVETGMVRLGAAIDNSIHFWRNGTMAEPIPLGGGDILLNSLRSGGELRIRQLPGAAITITIDGSPFTHGYLSNITYTPVSNFWLDQGYSWQNGTVNVTKGHTSVPITLLSKYEETQAQYLNNLRKPPDYSNSNHNVTLSFVNITPDGRFNTTSGNGIVQLKLNATIVRLLKEDVLSLTVNGVESELNYPVNVTIERLDIVLSVE
jgi:hypothetical protein